MLNWIIKLRSDASADAFPETFGMGREYAAAGGEGHRRRVLDLLSSSAQSKSGGGSRSIGDAIRMVLGR